MESEIIVAAAASSSSPERDCSNTAAAATRNNDIVLNSSSGNHEFETDSLGSRRIFKKTSPNALVTLYLGTREIVSKRGTIEPLRGVLFVDPKYVVGHRLFSQLTLTFRYGREDEEVMGLKFCNEAVIALKQIWPRTEETVVEPLSPLQEALLDRLGVGAHAFSIEVGIVAPPSVQLIPAKQYSGAPIGTSYDIRAYIADQADEKVQRRSTVKLGIRLVHKIPAEVRCLPSQTITDVSSLPKCLRLRLSPKALKFSNKLCRGGSGKTNGNRFAAECTTTTEAEAGDEDNAQAPQACVDKPFLWTDGKVSLRAALNKTAYCHDEPVIVTVDVSNNSRKIIRKIRVCAVQHVDVCMFSNGKFKNIVAEVNVSEALGPNSRLNRIFELQPIRTPTKNWIAVEGALFNSSMTAEAAASSNWAEHTRLAPSSPPELRSSEDRNVFAIYVSYYVKVKLTLSGMGGEVSLKLPFLLGHVDEKNDTATTTAAGVSGPSGRITTSSASVSNVEAGRPVSSSSSSTAVVVVEAKCEVISEMSEMSLSNTKKNVSIPSRTTTTTSAIEKDNDQSIVRAEEEVEVSDDVAVVVVDKNDKPVVLQDNLNNGRQSRKTEEESNLKVNEDKKEVEISTTVQVHHHSPPPPNHHHHSVSNGSRQS